MRSFVPKEKNSVFVAIWSAMMHARGISIIVPNLYSTRFPRSLNTCSATSVTLASRRSSSPIVATSGIMISGFALMPFSAESIAAPRIARICISSISG